MPHLLCGILNSGLDALALLVCSGLKHLCGVRGFSLTCLCKQNNGTSHSVTTSRERLQDHLHLHSCICFCRYENCLRGKRRQAHYSAPCACVCIVRHWLTVCTASLTWLSSCRALSLTSRSSAWASASLSLTVISLSCSSFMAFFFGDSFQWPPPPPVLLPRDMWCCRKMHSVTAQMGHMNSKVVCGETVVCVTCQRWFSSVTVSCISLKERSVSSSLSFICFTSSCRATMLFSSGRQLLLWMDKHVKL